MTEGVTWLDYTIFGLSLSISLGTGIYHAIRSKQLLRSSSTTTSEKDEYLMGGRNMPAIPVALSLLTSFLSGILMLAAPAEVFLRGPQIWVNYIFAVGSSIITCFVFLPVFHKLKCTCLHEYFIHRYNSPLIRKLFSSLFLAFTLSYMSIVIYAPSVALSAVLGINKWILILTFGLCTTLYTCIGGLKAVVWTDSLQAVIMYSGVFAVIIQGLRHPKVGGFSRVWQVAKDSGRVDELWRFDWRLDQKVIFYTLVPFFILVSAVTFIGFIVLAYFYNCNPLETKEITQTDHITILFAKNVLKDTPGLFGLYVSCIMSATLSTLSSGMNSMSAAIYEDFLKHRLDGKITDSQATKLNKLLVVLCGLTATALAFAAEPLGGILKVCIPVMGAMSGPMVAIFVLAMFFPSSGVVSCIVSYVISNIIMFIICVASFKQDPYKDLFLPTNTTIGGCGGNSNYTVLSMPPYDAHYGNPDTWYISRISTFGYSGLGFVIMMFVGICINMFYKEQNPENIAHLTYKGRKLDFPDAERIRKCISIPSNIVRDIAIPKRVIVKTK